MHPLFKLTDLLPVPAGTSPFHIKGFYYDRLLAHVRSRPGGLDALHRELRDDTVRRFTMQSFSWNAWYDALPSMPIYAAISRLQNKEFEALVRERTRLAAHQLVPSVFRLALRLVGPSAMTARVTQVVLRSDDFTRMQIEHLTDGHGKGSGSGIPLLIAPNVANLVLGWFQGSLELTGAHSVQARYTDVFVDGNTSGFETVTVRYEFSWQREKK